MPSPVSPRTLEDLVPPRNGSFCGRFIPGIINWMQARADFYRWMYKDNGDLTVSFITDLCIVKNGTVVIVPSTCPPMSYTASVKSRNTLLKLVFTGAGISDGLAWSLYRSTSVSGPWGAAITTGTTAGTTISYNDSGLVNNTTYYYQLQVTRPGCPVFSFVTSGTPRLCQTYTLQINVSSPIENAISVKVADLDGELQPGSTWVISIVGGAVLGSGIVGTDGACDVSGRPGVCFNTVIASDAPHDVVIRAVIQQGASCPTYTLEQAVHVNVPPLAAPRLILSNGILSWSSVTGAAGYTIMRMSLSECPLGGPLPVNQWLPVGSVGTSPRTFPISRQQFPANAAPAGTIQPRSQYVIYVVALAANGQPGTPSNIQSLDAWLGGTQCGR